MQSPGDKRGLSGRLTAMLEHRHPPAGLVLGSAALFIGIVTALMAILFRSLIGWVAWIGYTWLPDATQGWGKWYVIFVPAIGGLIVGVLVYRFAREAKGHGVPEVMEAVALRGGRIRPRVAVVKSLASSITIGSGGSAGSEGPVVQVGSAIGSTVGQFLGQSDERIANLVACGAAAGISATFNAPIAGVFFALEVILGRFSVRNFSSVVIASVTASVVGRAVFGDRPAFAIPVTYGVNSLWEFLFYPALGLLAALVGVLFVRLLYWSEDVFERSRRIPPWFTPAVGGVLLGVLAFAYPLLRLTQPVTWERLPQVFNVGYDIIEAALASELVLDVALVLLFAKIIATCLTLGSGGSGGVFAPSLFIGAMLGAAYQQGVDFLFPGVSAPAGAYALVGMAAVFAAGSHAPITAVTMLFELTGDYRIILPLMLTVVVATLVAQLLLRGESIYTLKLTRRGVRLERGRDVDILQGVTVGEVMSRDFAVIGAGATLEELSQTLSRTHHHGLMVMEDDGRLWGVATITDLERAMERNRPMSTPVREIGSGRPGLLVCYPNESIGTALARMGARGLGRLPVVSREDPFRLEGILRREGVTRAYTLALRRRSEIEQRTRSFQARKVGEAEYFEVPLSAGDRAEGVSVQAITGDMPRECILVSIRRDGRLIIPHGDTTFQAGDVITAFVRSEDAGQLYQALQGK